MDAFDLRDRVVVLTGAASGIGAATAKLLARAGAELHLVDRMGIDPAGATTYTADLGRAADIELLSERLPPRIDILLNCAGLPSGGRFTPAEIMAVNWLGLRALTENLLDRMPEGSAVVHIASTAGRGWQDRRVHLDRLLDAGGFDDGEQWVAGNPVVVGDGYTFSKEAVQYYTHRRSVETIRYGVRMNSVCPGVTNTPIADDFRVGVGSEIIDRAVEIAGRMAEPSEIAPAVLFLASEAMASYINGVNLNVDRGTSAARITGQW